MHGFAHAYPRALRIWRAYKCPAKFEVHVDTHCAAELIGEVWKSLCGAKGKHSVDKKADRSEQREWSLVEGEALRQAERHRERRRLKQVR